MTWRPQPPRHVAICLFAALLIASATGCGTTKRSNATEQLLTSDAVDHTVASIDFSALSGKRVFFDTSYIKTIKGVGFVNGDYITSALRQQLLAAHCALTEKKDEADVVVEARVGALGTDAHEVTYGIPSNNLLATAASLVPNAPPMPTIPEISLAKRSDQLAAAKIGVFAYRRETGEPFWQSGVKQVNSDAKDIWILGAGPFQHGSIYRKGPRFAGSRLSIDLHSGEDSSQESYFDERRFGRRKPIVVGRSSVQQPVEDAGSTENTATESNPAATKTEREPDSSRPNPPSAAKVLQDDSVRQMPIPDQAKLR